MKKTTLLVFSLVVISVLLIAGCTQTQTLPAPTAKPTEVATIINSKPLVVNPTVASQEAQCAKSEKNPPWTSTLLSYEHHDSTRSKLYACAQFTGSFTGPNTVNVYKSPDNYYSGSMIATRDMNEMYVYGGASGANPMPSGAYISKVEPGTLKEIWRTQLVDLNATGAWSGAGSIESINGEIFVITNTQLFKINGKTGAIESALNLPTGEALLRMRTLTGWAAGRMAH